MIKLKRLTQEPILKPVKNHPWEAAAVFNCATIMDNGLIHMIYRATDKSCNVRDDSIYLNYFGYAVSKDGINFNRMEKPIMGPEAGTQEGRGVEDPRIVKIDDTYHMLYTGYGARFKGDFRICRATSKNLIDWEKQGMVLDEPNKNASLFPKKINGKYYLLHRREPNIWLAESTDMKTWENHQIIMEPKEDSSWEKYKVGIAGAPVETDFGWILVYHAVSNKDIDGVNGTYSLGIAVLDKEDPSKVLFRQEEPILEPELEWEINGMVPNVVFSTGNIIKDNQLYIYYCGADTVIGVATGDIDEIAKKIK